MLVGEDGTANYEAQGVIIENNLMLGNSLEHDARRVRRQGLGRRDLPAQHGRGKLALARLRNAPESRRRRINPCATCASSNNIWSDPTGTMEDFSDTPPADTTSFTLANNLY